VFVVSGGKLTGTQIVARVVQNLNRILQSARKRGPFMYAIYEKQITLIWPKDPI
jgi:hypothetical protein